MPGSKRARTECVPTVSTLVGSTTASGFADGDARFKLPCGVAVDADGNVIVADSCNNRIRKVTPDGTVSTLAGAEDSGFADGNGSDARFNEPHGVAVDADGNVIVADSCNNRIRTVSACNLSRGVAVPRWHVAPSTITSDYLGMLSDQELVDTVFDVDGTQIRAHRIILASRSAYFRAMFASTCREAEHDAVIHVRETTPAAFRQVLAFVYTDALELNDEIVVDVLRKVCEYGLTRAHHLCMRYCMRHVGTSNAVRWLLQADACRLDDLRELMISYVKRNFRSIREEAIDTLAALRANPDLMFEVMAVAMI